MWFIESSYNVPNYGVFFRDNLNLFFAAPFIDSTEPCDTIETFELEGR